MMPSAGMQQQSFPHIRNTTTAAPPPPGYMHATGGAVNSGGGPFYYGSGFSAAAAAVAATSAAIRTQLIPVQIKCVKNVQERLFFCPRCSLPMSAKTRLLPCYHVICDACTRKAGKDRICHVCNSTISSIIRLHPKDELFECEEAGCYRVFLSLSSLEYHRLVDHQLRFIEPLLYGNEQHQGKRQQQGKPLQLHLQQQQENEENLLERIRNYGEQSYQEEIAAVAASSIPNEMTGGAAGERSVTPAVTAATDMVHTTIATTIATTAPVGTAAGTAAAAYSDKATAATAPPVVNGIILPDSQSWIDASRQKIDTFSATAASDASRYKVDTYTAAAVTAPTAAAAATIVPPGGALQPAQPLVVAAAAASHPPNILAAATSSPANLRREGKPAMYDEIHQPAINGGSNAGLEVGAMNAVAADSPIRSPSEGVFNQQQEEEDEDVDDLM